MRPPPRARSLVRSDLSVLQAEAKRRPGTTPFPEVSGRMILSSVSLFASLKQNDEDAACK